MLLAEGYNQLTTWRVGLVIAICFVVYRTATALRAHLNHPLSKFPGPPTAAFSNFRYCSWFLGGRQPYTILDLHKKYGPVVRTAPNELSFNTAGSWRDIYGFRKGHDTFVKSPFYDGGSFAAQAHSIVSERDPEEHGKMRKYLSNAFSDRSLKEQEPLITETVDLFIDQLGKYGAKGVDMVMWFNLTTFDIIGDLAFGEPFGGVASGTTHFWVSIVISSLSQGALADCLSRFPFVGYVFKKLFSGAMKAMTEDTARHEKYTTDLIRRRINKPTDRKDFMTRILENREEYKLSEVQIAAHASDFVVAGSETTATTLACMTYYLLRTPRVMQTLREEIDAHFNDYDEIDSSSTANLKYLQAVILEGMRIYPPLPLSLPRVVPAGGDTVDGHYLPAGTIVSTNPVAASLSSANFRDPYEFVPERWLGANEVDILEASQPFSAGSRACLGRSLGWMELRIILVKLLFTYDLRLLNDDLDWHRDSEMHTLWKKPELPVEIKPRQRV